MSLTIDGYKAAAKLIRADLKAAQARGELAAHLTFSVRFSIATHDPAIDIAVRGCGDAFLYTRDEYGHAVYTREAIRFQAQVEQIARARTGHGKYFYLSVALESDHGREMREHQAATAKARRGTRGPS